MLGPCFLTSVTLCELSRTVGLRDLFVSTQIIGGSVCSWEPRPRLPNKERNPNIHDPVWEVSAAPVLRIGRPYTGIVKAPVLQERALSAYTCQAPLIRDLLDTNPRASQKSWHVSGAPV